MIGFIVSCKSDEPGPLGSDLIPGEDEIIITEISSLDDSLSQKSSDYHYDIDLGDAGTIFLGRESSGYEASLLLRFFIVMSDSIREAVDSDEITVLNSWIELHPTYTLGDKSSTFNFSVHNINGSWSSRNFNSDSLSVLDYDSENILGSLKENTDTLVSFYFSNDRALLWLQKVYNDDLPDNNGLLLLPDAATNKIMGFGALSSLRLLNEPQLFIEVEKAGSFVDTVVAAISGDVSVVGSEYPVSSGNIYVEGGTSVRSKVWFDLSAIEKNTVINKAELSLFIDSTNSFIGSRSSDSLDISFSEDSVENVISESYLSKLFIREGNKYKADITNYVQHWINGVDNDGIIINVNSEKNTLNKIAFHSSSAGNGALRPRLDIVLTRKR